MHLSALHVYPVKSCAPLSLDQATVEPRGLAHDRRWMVVDADGRFVTGRQLPRLTLMRAVPVDGGLSLQAPGMSPLEVPFPQGERSEVTVWDDTVRARLADASAHAWLGAFLGQPARLVHLGEDCVRPANDPRASPGDEVSFADAFPLLLISQAALDGLNARLARPVSMLQFRPNLVIDGVPAHAEDEWKSIRVGEVEFEVAKACVRCIFTTVDPARGERDPSGEPLKTLIQYRRTPKGVTFGQNLIARSPGRVRVGDPVEVLA